MRTTSTTALYLTDTFDVIDPLSVTLTGRYNIAKVDLADRNGDALNGNNRFTHFDPSAGVTYKVLPALTVYGSYAINNRAPTASELECANPAAPCLLPTNLASDPPLKQVVCENRRSRCAGHPIRRESRQVRLGPQRLSHQLRERHLRHLDDDRIRLLSERRLDAPRGRRSRPDLSNRESFRLSAI